MASLQEKYAELKDNEIQIKLAAVEEAWGDNPETLDLLAEAWDIVKEASDNGEFDHEVDDSQALNLAVQMVAELLEEANRDQDETNEVDETTSDSTEEVADEDAVTEEQVKAAEYQLFVEAGRVLCDLGITKDEIEKIATEQEREEFADLVAEIVVTLLNNEA